MRNVRWVRSVLLSLGLAGVPFSLPAGEPASEPEATPIVLALRDGSRVSGQPIEDTLSVQTSYASLAMK